jgi:hypothetical protein
MKYLMLVCRDPAIELTPEQRAAMRDSVIAWVDEMVEVAAKHPVAALGAIDVRPLWE